MLTVCSVLSTIKRQLTGDTLRSLSFCHPDLLPQYGCAHAAMTQKITKVYILLMSACQILTGALPARLIHCTTKDTYTIASFYDRPIIVLCCLSTDFHRIPSINTYVFPFFKRLTWGDATKLCFSLSPFAHLVIFNSYNDFSGVQTFLRTISGK